MSTTNKNSRILKTFDSDIDKWTAKIGIFGKSFNELGTAVNNAFKSYIDNIDNFDENVGFWESLKKNLFSPKKDIKTQLIDVMPEINSNNISDATEKIKKMTARVAEGEITWQKLFDTLPEGKKHYAQLGQQMENQIITEEGVIQANQQARDSAIAHNNALKQQTLGAKAASVGLKALSAAGNMLAFMAISKGIELVVTGIDRLVHSAEYAQKAIQEATDSAKSFSDSIKNVQQETVDMEQSVRSIVDRYAELSQGVNNLTNENLDLPLYISIEIRIEHNVYPYLCHYM